MRSSFGLKLIIKLFCFVNNESLINFKIFASKVYLPNIFVSTVGDEIKGWEVAVYSQQVQTQQHHQYLDDDPHQGSAGTQSKNLWTEPSHKDNAEFYLTLSDTCLCIVSHKINLMKRSYSPFLNAEGHSSK